MHYNFTLRKIVHITTGLIISWLAWILPYPEIILVAFVIMVIVLLIEYFRITDDRLKQFFRSLLDPFLRKKEGGHLVGSAWLTVGAFLTVMVSNPTATVSGFLLWALADPSGEIAGRTIKGPQLYRGSSKTWAGTISVFAVGILTSGIWLSSQSAANPWTAAVIISFAVTVVEACSELLHIDDNLSIPLVGALVTQALLSL